MTFRKLKTIKIGKMSVVARGWMGRRRDVYAKPEDLLGQ
jgi:hypothetical protein